MMFLTILGRNKIEAALAGILCKTSPFLRSTRSTSSNAFSRNAASKNESRRDVLLFGSLARLHDHHAIKAAPTGTRNAAKLRPYVTDSSFQPNRGGHPRGMSLMTSSKTASNIDIMTNHFGTKSPSARRWTGLIIAKAANRSAK